jgi:putative sterol carrier protein
MSEIRRRFFERVAKQGHVPLLEGTSGTLLVEIKDGKRTEHRYVNVRRGDVTVSAKGSAPDCTIRTDGQTFDDIVTSRISLMPAVLRGLVAIEGKVRLAVALQALYAPSPGAAGKQVAGYARRES